MSSHLALGVKPWNRTHFNEVLAPRDGDWSFCGDPAALETVLAEGPRFNLLFFLHWSSLVPESITERFECVCFHMTDVPYGRGGSPLQNLIARGHRETMLTALRMEKGLDTGPVYFKRPLSLEGAAEEVYIRASRLSCEMAAEIVESRPEPVPQAGEAVVFRRRRPDQSRFPAGSRDLLAVHDHIRMLDADGYPPAFIETDGLRLEFSRSAFRHDAVHADVRITMKTDS